MKDYPIEVAVSITVKARLLGYSVEEIERDCAELRSKLLAKTPGDSVKDATVEYSVAEVAHLGPASEAKHSEKL